jgi:hypothetical protein
MLLTLLVTLLGLAEPRDLLRRVPCEGPDAVPWVTDFRDRLLDYDELTRFAVGRYGAPVACEGTLTDEFDGAVFGTLLLTFSEGVTLEAQTLPPESSITTLRAAAGFGEGAEVREALRAHAAGIGLQIDWTTPEVTMEGDERVESYWDRDPGLNASASLVSRNGELVAVRLSMAL